MTDQAKHCSLRPHKGKALFVLGDVVTLKLSAAETNSAYSLVEIVSVPGGGPAFLHTHQKFTGFRSATNGKHMALECSRAHLKTAGIPSVLRGPGHQNLHPTAGYLRRRHSLPDARPWTCPEWAP
jgi:hypothetical protein